jgi:hypothetical protein
VSTIDLQPAVQVASYLLIIICFAVQDIAFHQPQICLVLTRESNGRGSADSCNNKAELGSEVQEEDYQRVQEAALGFCSCSVSELLGCKARSSTWMVVTVRSSTLDWVACRRSSILKASQYKSSRMQFVDL